MPRRRPSGWYVGHDEGNLRKLIRRPPRLPSSWRHKRRAWRHTHTHCDASSHIGQPIGRPTAPERQAALAPHMGQPRRPTLWEFLGKREAPHAQRVAHSQPSAAGGNPERAMPTHICLLTRARAHAEFATAGAGQHRETRSTQIAQLAYEPMLQVPPCITTVAIAYRRPSCAAHTGWLQWAVRPPILRPRTERLHKQLQSSRSPRDAPASSGELDT